jgi:hypothetical protein
VRDTWLKCLRHSNVWETRCKDSKVWDTSQSDMNVWGIPVKRKRDTSLNDTSLIQLRNFYKNWFAIFRNIQNLFAICDLRSVNSDPEIMRVNHPYGNTIHSAQSRAAERGAGGGGNCPGAPGSEGPKKFFVGAQSFFWVKYFCAKGKIFFLGGGGNTEIWYGKLR